METDRSFHALLESKTGREERSCDKLKKSQDYAIIMSEQTKKYTWIVWLKNDFIKYWCLLDKHGYPLALVRNAYKSLTQVSKFKPHPKA